MNVELKRVRAEEKEVLFRLLQLYLYDFTEFADFQLNEKGLYGYKYFDSYFEEPDRHPFFILAEGKIAGFALVNRHCVRLKEGWSVAEFFVLKQYRRKGVGKQAAFLLFDLFSGGWDVHQMSANLPAQKFWRKTISDYTEGNFEPYEQDGFGEIFYR